jgi:hypothetical protein
MIRENTGNFSDFGCPGADLRRKYLVISGVFFEIPYSTEQGILKREQGIILLEQGISWEQQGSRFQFHSTGQPYWSGWCPTRIPQTAKSLEIRGLPP